jgi:hypothetical protein
MAIGAEPSAHRDPAPFGVWTMGSGVIAVDLTDRLYGRASKWRKA